MTTALLTRKESTWRRGLVKNNATFVGTFLFGMEIWERSMEQKTKLFVCRCNQTGRGMFCWS
jgi:hypothetical protein